MLLRHYSSGLVTIFGELWTTTTVLRFISVQSNALIHERFRATLCLANYSAKTTNGRLFHLLRKILTTRSPNGYPDWMFRYRKCAYTKRAFADTIVIGVIEITHAFIPHIVITEVRNRSIHQVVCAVVESV